MTEREIPSFRGFPLGGKTNDTQSSFAPPAVSRPESPMNSELEPTVSEEAPARVFMSRREMRAAGGYQNAQDAVAPSASPERQPSATSLDLLTPPDGIASLFPFLGDVTAAAPVGASPVEPARAESPPTHPATESTLAMPVADIAAELATPVAPIVIAQEPIPVIPPIPPSWHRADEPSIDQLLADQLPADLMPAEHSPAEHHATRRARRKASEAPAGRRPREKRTRPARAAYDRKSIRQRLTGLGVMMAVGGLFAVLALPAYADNNASALTASTAIRTQKFAVSAAAATDVTASVRRDSYTATSAADLKTLYSNAIRKQNLSAYMQSGAKAQGDDYPWFAELSRNQGGGLSPLNYYYRECVDFVAWRLNRDAGSTSAPFKWVWSNLTPSGGNASQWKSAWLNHGWATGTTPKVGSVAWFPYNHVAYVSGILNDGSVAVEEYNWQGQHLYSTRIIQPGDAYYLYAPPA